MSPRLLEAPPPGPEGGGRTFSLDVVRVANDSGLGHRGVVSLGADAVMDQLDVDSKAKSFLIHESKSLFSILFPSPLFCFCFFLRVQVLDPE